MGWTWRICMMRSVRGYGHTHLLVRLLFGMLICGLILGAVGCTAQPVMTANSLPTATATIAPTNTPEPIMTPTDVGAVEQLRPEVVATYPHDSTAFTEGLLFDSGRLYESTGLYGDSSLRQVDPTSGQVLRAVSLPSQFFGEGLALANNRLVQLSWREDTAFIYDPTTFARLGQYTYTGEGWGLCFDGRWFYMSDGSSSITIRDPDTFEPSGALHVALDDQPVEFVNELECVGGWVYANVWHTDQIIRIDKDTGRVSAVIEAAGLLPPDQQRIAGPEGVLNGIAYDPARATFFITGKHWPSMFEVRFVPAAS